jgi:integrase
MAASRKAQGTVRYQRGYIRKTRYGTFRAEVNARGRKFRATKRTVDDAKAWIDRTLSDIDNSDHVLSSFETEDAKRAIGLLPEDVTLQEAAKHFVETRTAGKPILLSDAVEKFLLDKNEAGLRAASIASLKVHVERLLDGFDGCQVGEITGERLSDWFRSHGITGRNRKNYRTDLRTFFNWCQSSRYIALNPTDSISVPKTDETLPGIFALDEIMALLNAAEDSDRKMVPYLALALFAGLRPKELHRLRWKSIEEQIHIGPEAAKTRQQRYVTIEPNLAEWLENYKSKGSVIGINHVNRLVKVREVAGLTHWPPDVLRHCFATYHLARYQDAPRTSHELGHASTNMLYRNYRNLATAKDGVKFFNLRPGLGQLGIRGSVYSK